MKNNSPTNTILNIKTSDIKKAPNKGNCTLKRALGGVLTLVLFFTLVKLGFWQLERGVEKQALEQQFSARAEQPYLPLAQVIERGDWRWEQVLGLRVSAEVYPSEQPVILLDNQVYQGGVGYLAYQIVRYHEHLLLLELGFVAAGQDRSQLPDVTALAESTMVTGRLYLKQENWLSNELHLEAGYPSRIQNLRIEQLGNALELTLLPVVLQPDNLSNWLMPFPWHPLPMQSSKHFGYAIQWFAMAGFLVLCVTLLIIRLKKEQRSR